MIICGSNPTNYRAVCALWQALVVATGMYAAGASAQNLQDSGLDLPGVWAGQAAWGDYDGDGDIDLGIIGEVTEDGVCNRIARVLRNDSALLVEDVAQSGRLTGVYFGDLGWADYDSDGDLDLAIAGWDAGGEESLRLYLNEEGGEPAERLLTFDVNQVDGNGDPNLKGVRYAALSWVDYDNDGDLDLIVSGMESIGTSLTHLYRNTGGKLELDVPNSESIINVHEGDLAWADYDNDGDLDLAISGENVTTDGGIRRVTEFYVNNPLGSLTLDTRISLPFDALVKSGALTWADYDSDGDPDLAISGRDEIWNRGLHLYLNRFAGTFSRDTAFALNTSQMIDGHIDWVDYDNDGDPDLAVSGQTLISTFTAKVFENRDGSVTGFAAEQSIEGLVGGVAVWGDYDADGRVDLVTSGVDAAGESRTILYSNLGETAVNTPPDPPASLNPVEVTSSGALFRWSPGNDAESDALTYNIRIGTAEGLGDIVSAIIGVGSGNVGIETSYLLKRDLPPDTYFWSVQSVDGAFASSNFASEGEFVVGRFVSSDQNIRNLTESAMSWGDYDGDGDDDLAIMGRNRSGETQSLLYINDNRLLTLHESEIVSLEEGDLGWGDYDGDGDLDLIIAGEDVVGTRAVRLYETLLDGAVQERLRFTPTLSESSVDWGDVDNDGDLDLLLMGQSDATEGGAQLSFTEIWQNDGSGDFDTLGVNLTGLNNGEGLFADIDNDGDLDLATTGVSSDGTRAFNLYKNDRAKFSETGNGLPGIESSDIAFGDYDRDGDLDLAAGGVLANNSTFAAIYTNDGSGTYEELAIGLPGIQGGDLTWGDYDNDQDLDLVFVGNIGQGKKVLVAYENTIGRTSPDSAFAYDIIPALTGVDFSSVALADIDVDGDLDLISAGTSNTPSTAVNDNLTAQQANANIAPSTPSGLRAEDNGNDVTLTWLPSSDFGAPPVESLSYNVRVGTTSGGNDVVSWGHALGRGNAGHNLSRSILGLDSGTYSWSVQAVDAAFTGSEWSAQNEFIIDTVAPEVGSLTLNRNTLGIDQTATLALEFVDLHSGLDYSVEPVVEATWGGESFRFASLQYTGQTWSGELIALPTMPSGDALVTVRGVQDLKGNSLIPVDSAATFTIDTERPSVTIAEPAFDATGVAAATNQIRITFSEPLDERMVIRDNFQITIGQSPLSLAVDPSYDSKSNTVILTPDGGLLPGTSYTIEVSAAVEDLAGNGPANAISWTFDTALPQVTATTPASGATHVPIDDGTIRVSFDSGIITALLDAADAVQVLREGDVVNLSAKPVFDVESNNLSFELEDGLKPGSRYEIVLSGLLAGPLRALGDGDFRWPFTTAVPQVTSLTPADGNMEVSVAEPTIAVVFDGLIDQDAVAGSVALLEQGEQIPTTDEEYNPATNILSVQPADGLRVGTSYQVVVSGLVGGPLRQAAGDYRWSFSTSVPQLVAVEPEADRSDVTIDLVEAAITFSNPLDPRDLTGSFTIAREGIPVELRDDDPVDRSEGRYGLAPKAGWQVGSSYMVAVSSVVTGPLGEGELISWQFQTAVPDTISVSPEAGDTTVSARNTAVSVVFDNAVDEVALRQEGNVLLLEEGRPVETSTPILDGNTVSFASTSGRFRAGSNYQVQIDRAIAGPKGEDDFRWDFATRVPAIVSTDPEDGGSVPAGARRIVIFLSELADEDVVTSSRSFSLTGGGGEVTLSDDEFIYDDESLTVTLPEIVLQSGSAYQLTMSARIGGRRARRADNTISFFTDLPTLVETEPEFGAEGVSVRTPTIQLMFSGPVAREDATGFQLRARSLNDIMLDPETPFEIVTLTEPGFDPQLTTVSFAPQSGFQPFTEYEVVIDRSVLGDRAESGFDGTFRTAGVLPDVTMGGTVTSADASLELYFPPNSFSGGTGEIVLRPLTELTPGKIIGAADLSQSPNAVGNAWEIDIGTSTLRKPVTLSFNYDARALTPAQVTQLGIFRRSGNDWVRVGGTPDRAQSRVNTTVDEFSVFGLFIDSETARGSVEIRELDCQPRAFSPVGYRTSTDISFELTSPADVTARVFNASGRLERIVERSLALGPGRHTLSWDGRDENGDVVASGLYVVVVTSAGEQAEKVVAVVR